MDTPTEQNETDGRLIERAAQGDSDAVRQIVDAHQSMVYGTCLRILGNSADAEDAAQATFIVFLKKAAKIKRGTVLGGWLYRSAQLVSRESIRSTSRRKKREQEASTMNTATAEDTAAIWKDLAPELDAGLMALTQKYRDVVVLRYLEGRTTDETAGALGISASAVATNLSRALEQLRSLFRRRGVVLSTGVLTSVLAENAAATAAPAVLKPAALMAAAGGASATAASGLMAKAALAKMGSIAWLIFNALIFIAWVDCMVSWLRQGCPMPRWVHVFAACLTAAGIALMIAAGLADMLTPKLATALLLVPPLAAYGGWLWLFGPEWGES